MVPVLIFFVLCCFPLGSSLGNESCGQSEVDSKPESSYLYEQVSPEDWKAGNSDDSEHSHSPEPEGQTTTEKYDESPQLFGVYCFALGFSLGKQSCGNSYSNERISPEDWKADSDQRSTVMVDVAQHSKVPEGQLPLSVGKIDTSKNIESPKERPATRIAGKSQRGGISDGSELSQEEPNESLPSPEELVYAALEKLSLSAGSGQTTTENVDQSQQSGIPDGSGTDHDEPNEILPPPEETIDEAQQSKESEEQLPLSAGKSDESEHSESPEGQTSTETVDESQESGISDGPEDDSEDDSEDGSEDGSELGDDDPYEILPIPEEWEIYTFVEIHQHFDCYSHAKDQSKPLHTLEQWQYMREKYSEVVDRKVKFDDPVPPTEGYTLNNGGPPPYYAKFSPGKGRGIFASRDISEGELVHDGGRSAVAFKNAMAWRRYVFALPEKMACDIAEWSWTQKLTRLGRMRVLVDLTIAAFFNSGEEGEEANVMPRGGTGLKFFATRDIEKDSELLYDYYVYDTDWKKVGLD